METISRYLDEAITLGVREIYFTGGEPFLHKQILSILEDALQVAPTTVLTNGTLITPAMAEALGALQTRSRYSLEIRVSLDDIDEAQNDAVRGKGALRKAVRALQLLQDQGLVPIIAVTEYLYDADTAASQSGEGSGFYRKFREFLIANGISKPRLKMIPVFAMGQLDGTVPLATYVTPQMMQGFDAGTLQCTSSRVLSLLTGFTPVPSWSEKSKRVCLSIPCSMRNSHVHSTTPHAIHAMSPV